MGTVIDPAFLNCFCEAVIENVVYNFGQLEDLMLNQSAVYSTEAQKLLYLYGYINKWTLRTDPALIIKSWIIGDVLIAAVDGLAAEAAKKRLLNIGISKEKT